MVHYSAFTFSSISSCMSDGMTIFPKMFSNSLQSLRRETILQVCETSPFLMCLQFSGVLSLKANEGTRKYSMDYFFQKLLLVDVLMVLQYLSRQFLLQAPRAFNQSVDQFVGLNLKHAKLNHLQAKIKSN